MESNNISNPNNKRSKKQKKISLHFSEKCTVIQLVTHPPCLITNT
jgi:hypothetical protein